MHHSWRVTVSMCNMDRVKAIPLELLSRLPRRGPSLRARQIALVQALRMVPDRSNRTLAIWCGVSRELVAKTRRRLVDAGEIRAQPDHLGGDGKRYRLEYPRDGAKRA